MFNFFRPTYTPTSRNFTSKGTGTRIINAQMVAPELYLLNETSIAGYVNYMQRIAKKGLVTDGKRTKTTDGKNKPRITEIKPDYAELTLLTEQPLALIDRLNLILYAGSMSAITQNYILQAIKNNQTKQAEK